MTKQNQATSNNEALVACPVCSSRGSNDFEDILDCYPCCACSGTGKAEKGTKIWLEKLIESKV